MAGKKKKIGVKFCGGCNPLYGRGEAFKKISAKLNSGVEFTRYDAADIDGLLLIAGCSTDCVDRSQLTRLPDWILTSEDSIGRIIEEIADALNL